MNKLSLAIAIATLLALACEPTAAAALDCRALVLSGATMPRAFPQQCAAIPVAGPVTAPADGRSPTDSGFAVDIFGSGARPRDILYSFVLNNFPGQSVVNNTTQEVQAMDFSPSTTELFAVTSKTAASYPANLGVIYQQAGDFVPVAALSGLPEEDSINGLAIHPRTGAAYLSTSGGSPPSARLFSVNLTTAALTLIGQMSAPTDPTGTIMISLAMNCAGQLYAHNISDDALYLVNSTTAATTYIGSHGFDANFAQGMDFDNSDGQLYMFMMQNSAENRFGRISTSIGAFTTLANNNPPGEFEGAIPTLCPASLSLFADGFEG